MRSDYAHEKWWALADGGHAQEREHNGYKLRVEKEESGYRLYVNGVKRGFFDRTKPARSQGIWLAENGNPAWRVDQAERSFRPTIPGRDRVRPTKAASENALGAVGDAGAA